MDATLTILSNASCFLEDLRKQSSLVKEVRNKWLCSDMDQWTWENAREARSMLMALAMKIPGAQQSMNKHGEKFPYIAFYANVQNYRSYIRYGKHKRIHFKIEKLQNDQGKEIYVERTCQASEVGIPQRYEPEGPWRCLVG